MFKKTWVFNIIFCLVLLTNSFWFLHTNSHQTSNYVSNENTYASNISSPSTRASDVSNMEEFFNAANANQDINITADIDFSEATSSDYLISNYSGEINGNNHTLYNGLTELSPDPNHLFYSLFDVFSGEIRNITLDNFPFFANELKKSLLNTTTPDIENITIINTTIEGFSDVKEYSSATDEYTSVRTGLFTEKATNYNLSGFSITNSGFVDNSFTFYKNGSETILEIYFGMVAGELSNSILSNSYLIDDSFSNNQFYRYEDETEETLFSGAFELGMLSGRSLDTTLKYNFINNIDISNNIINASNLRFGTLNGFSKALEMEENYISSIYIKDNKFTISSPDGFDFSILTGYVTDTDTSSFVKNIISDSGVSGNMLATELGGTFSPVEPGEYGTNADYHFTKSDKNYFVGGSGTNSNINYIDEESVNADFWKNDIQFNAAIWNLNNLVDPNLEILDDPSEPGYPIFNTLNYLFNSFDISGTTLKFNFKNIASSDSISFKIKSIFGDEWNLSLNGADVIDTMIPSSYFDDKTSEEILYFINQSFWFELETTSSFNNLIFIGDLNNILPKTFETPTMTLSSSLSAPVKDSTFSTITFSGEATDDALIVSDLSKYNSFTVTNKYGVDNIVLGTTNTIQVPAYIDDYDRYYQINILQTFDYIDQNKTIQTQNINIEGEITNVTSSPEEVLVPKLNLNTAYNEETKKLTLTLIIEDSDFYVETAEGLTNTTFKITSTFQEFDGNYEANYTLNDFTKIDANTFSKEILLTSRVQASTLNSFYAIEINSSLEYYTDLSANKATIDQINVNGDLTNEDTSTIVPYDPSKTFDGTIQTEFVDGKKIKIFFNEDFPYLLDYQINLVLKTEKTTQEISFSNNTANSIEVDVVPELAKYYASLSKTEQESFNINNYYSIDFDSSNSSEITFLDARGTFQKEIIDSWEVASTKTNGTLKLDGDLTNITGTVQPIPEVSSSNIPFIVGLVSTLLLLILLIIFFLWFIYRKFKVKSKEEFVLYPIDNVEDGLEESPTSFEKTHQEYETKNQNLDNQNELEVEDNKDLNAKDEPLSASDEQDRIGQQEPIQDFENHEQDADVKIDDDSSTDNNISESKTYPYKEEEQEKTNEQILEEWL